MELYHYGVLGMKWGVRRYQKKDGSLTRAGKKLIDEGATLYPTYKGKHLKYMSERSKNRDMVFDKVSSEVAKDRLRKYESYIKKNPNFAKNVKSKSDRISMWDANVRDKNEKEATRQKYAKQFIDEYGDATLKDLDISINTATKQYVQDLIENRRLSGAVVE